MIFLALVALVFAVATAVAAIADVARHPSGLERPVDPPTHVRIIRRRPYDWDAER